MRTKFTIAFFVLFLYSTSLLSQGIADQVKIDSLNKYVRELSGDKSIVMNGVSSTIRSRNTVYSSSDINLAAAYLKSKFQSFGLQAIEQPFTFTSGSTTINAKNILAFQTGNLYPYKKYIICAHYDDLSLTGDIAPGADDNASGTAAVIEAARIISMLNPKYTIMYALWSGEEQGEMGSWFYANKAKVDNEEILGVINLDMIASDFNGNSVVQVEYKKLADGKQPLMDNLLRMLTSVIRSYGINMAFTKYSNTPGGSDHYPFLYHNFPAFLMREDVTNSNLHSANDLFSYLYLSYFEKCSKLAICTLAELAQAGTTIVGIDDKNTIPTDFSLNQNYPNPFNPSTLISYRLAAADYVKLKIFDLIGREIITLVDEYQSAGEHSSRFSIQDKSLNSGIYFYKLQTGNLTLTKKMVCLK